MSWNIFKKRKNDLRYFYVTYEWRIDSKYGYGDLTMRLDTFSVKNFKEAASSNCGIKASLMHINPIEITEEEFELNIEEFKNKIK